MAHDGLTITLVWIHTWTCSGHCLTLRVPWAVSIYALFNGGGSTVVSSAWDFAQSASSKGDKDDECET